MSLSLTLKTYYVMNTTKVMYFGEKDQRGKVPFLSHYIKSTYSQYTVDVNLAHLAEKNGSHVFLI